MYCAVDLLQECNEHQDSSQTVTQTEKEFDICKRAMPPCIDAIPVEIYNADCQPMDIQAMTQKLKEHLLQCALKTEVIPKNKDTSGKVSHRVRNVLSIV